MVLNDVEAVPASSKPPVADVSMCTFTSERCSLGASVLLFTRASPMPFSEAKGSDVMPKLVKLVGSSSTQAGEISP